MHLGTWYWDSKLCKWCCSRVYKREGRALRAFESALVFTRLNAVQRWVGRAPRKGHTHFWEKVIEIRRCLWTIHCRENWNQHSQQLYWTTGRFIQCKKEAKCGNLISKDRRLWMIIALFCISSVNRMKEITPKATNAFDITAFSQLHCLFVVVIHVAVIWPLTGSIIYLVP